MENRRNLYLFIVLIGQYWLYQEHLNQIVVGLCHIGSMVTGFSTITIILSNINILSIVLCNLLTICGGYIIRMKVFLL